jgi:bifunctional DNA-binding transcriptional regulator/antitoxin component of YhaV-PrlF toxin-antitoxin module
MSEKQTFEVLLEKADDSRATGITVPFDVENIYGAKRVPVKVSINNAGYRGTVCRMGGKYMMIVPKAFRDAAGVKAGDRVKVVMERDLDERAIEAPDDLLAALSSTAGAKAAWDKLSYTHKKEHVLAIQDAKREETRAGRIEKTLAMLISKRK